MRFHLPLLHLLPLGLAALLTGCEVSWDGMTTEELGAGDNLAPELVLDTPTVDGVYTTDTAVPFVGSVSDDGLVSGLFLTITSNRDGLIDRPPVAEDWSFTTSGVLTSGSHQLTVTVTDQAGLQASLTRTIQVEEGTGPGPALTVTLDPAAPIGATETLCVITAEDPTGLPVTITSNWQVNDTDAGSAELPISGLNRDDALSCVVSATSAAGTTDGQESATVGNSPPEALSVQVDGAPATETDTLTCSAETSDYDGDSVTPAFAWVVNGTVALEGSSTVTGASFDRDDAVQCRVTPQDSQDDGTALDSAAVTIENTAPNQPSDIRVTPETGLIGAGLTCSVGATGTDVDSNDVLTNEFRWTVDGVESASETSQVFGTATLAEGATLTCAARTSDGDLASSWVNASNTVSLSQGLAGVVGTDDAWTTIAGTTGGDRLGRALAAVGDLNSDGVPEVVLGANQHDSNRGKAYLFDGATLSAGGSLDDGDALVSWTGPAQGSLFAGGEALVDAGDVTGGGVNDVLIAAYRADSVGAVYLFAGEEEGSWTTGTAEGDAALQFHGDAEDDDFGLDIGTADLDGDGRHDVLIGAPYNDDNGESAGVVTITLAAGLPASGSIDVGDADHTLTGTDAGDLAGYAAMERLGDVDGDGHEDFAIGARDAGNTGGTAAGVLYILSGADFADGSMPATGTLASAASWQVEGASSGDQLGMAAASLGDLDGDGSSEFAVGARYADVQVLDAGGVYVFFGGALGGTTSASDAEASFGSEAGSDLAGKNLAVGDVDNDGFTDLVVSSHYHDGNGSNSGTAWLLLGGGWTGWTPNATLSDSAQATFQGNSNNDYLSVMSDLVDLDADGFDEILIGADSDDGQRGTVYLFAQP